jgi:enamine deaminase RidA (YjgF/YER057c/UK114 family)
MRKRHFLMLLLAISLSAKKKNPDEETQTLALPRDCPQVAVGETSRLAFHVSPLSGKGLLSQQTRDALKAILKANGGVPVVHIRAFVAGSGDVRRVPQIVSEVLTEKKMALPSVSVVLAGGLPLDNAQVVLEAVSNGRREANPAGLDFIASEQATEADPLAPPQPLLEKALNQLASKVNAASVVEVSCFVSALNNANQLTASIQSRFPSAAVDLVQTRRAPLHALAGCEAVVRGGKVKAEKLAFSGTRVASGSLEKDATLAFQRLDRDLTEAAAPPANIVFTNIYALSDQAAEVSRRLRTPDATILFEGLAAMDAGFAVDVVATVN